MSDSFLGSYLFVVKYFKKVFSQTCNDAGAYLDILSRIGRGGKAEDSGFIISDACFNEINKKIKTAGTKNSRQCSSSLGLSPLY